MKTNAIQTWLKKLKTGKVVGNVFASLAALLLGLVVLYATFWMAYALIYLGVRGVSAATELATGHRLRISHTGRLWCAGAFVVLLFFGNARTEPQELEDYSNTNYRPSSGIPMSLGVFGALGWLLAYPGGSSKMLAALFFTGPRLLIGSWHLAANACQLAKLDIGGTGQLLQFLLECGRVVPYEELTVAGWDYWMQQLRSVEGVVFLEKGLSLTQELRAELSALSAEEH